MEKIVIPVWHNRVSPVLDTATRLLVVDGPNGSTDHDTVTLPPGGLAEKVRVICDLGIDTVLCGAVSRTLYTMLSQGGIYVCAWVTGTVSDVLEAYFTDNLDNERFLLPGRGPGGQVRRRHRQRRRGADNTDFSPPSRKS